MSESGRVVVITGASSGIGAELARQLGARGFRVVLAARSREALEQVAATVGAEALVVPTDVTRRAEVEALRDAALERFGGVDVWVNNAGRGINRSVLELTDGDVDEMMTVNVKGPLYGMQAIIPHFQERRNGHLINVSSFLGRVPLATVRSAYNAAKSALNALTSNLRMDLAERWPGIHVSLVMPGVVFTPFAANALGAPAAAPPSRSPGMPGQTVEDATATIVELIERPAPELYTNPAAHALVRRYIDDVGAFEHAMRSGTLAPPTAAPA
jgi:NAD(P)-dependent dehydrogenase (short-subunit alcohol dehydrogenase family)